MDRPAVLCLDDGRIVDCVVRDTSEDGALVEVDPRAEIPTTFRLMVAGDARRCTVVRREADTVGVSFAA